MEATFAVSNLRLEQVIFFSAQQQITPEIEQALRRVLDQKGITMGLSGEIDARTKETDEIFRDQQRLRENMKSLKGSAEEKALIQRYTGQLNDEENRLGGLKKEIAELQSKLKAAKDRLDQIIMELSCDVMLKN